MVVNSSSSGSGRITPGTSSKRDSMASISSSSGLNSTSVKVVLRIRPSSASDPSIPPRFQRTVIHPLTPTTLQIEGGASSSSTVGNGKGTATPGKATFTFDRVIGPDEGQSAVYECAESLVDSFMEGMNSTILAYGQTASGKSYTMGTDRTFTSDEDEDEEEEINQDRLGITPRAVTAIFERMKEVQRETKGRTTFTAKLSYVEIYNEDLIDLLAGDLDVRPTVQIREDKAGNIIWSGLREVKVSSAAEVMKNLSAGSALRQTNATDMNAQSSRSHAIFSLTLTQRKYTGTGSVPPPPTPTSRNSRLSLLPRAGTPTNESRPGSRLRPASSGGRSSTGGEDLGSSTPSKLAGDGGETWSTVTSKFHFVDLAGSERLKRTAAQGERVKEGISINSGLHALGNVISALGDPARARQTTHIPYRDSKLTRLLQDSLGGNAQTMMVACVSPSEFNLNETISTVKYANRARNIKNRAEINEIEVGWDDVEYLQRTITRLRVELVALKSGEPGAGGDLSSTPPGEVKNSNGGKITDSDIQQRYAQLTAELTKARLVNSAHPSTLSRDDFARAVEPIVEEYEKSLSALESQLSLTKAALSHQEDEMRDLENRIDEEVRSKEANGALIGELKSRVIRLTEREATTEAYVRDLEGKLKDYDDLDESRGSAVSDLRKEITRSREQAEKTESYIKDLESRHTKADDTTASLQRQIEVLERDIERREEANTDLESRLSLLDTSGDHKLLLAEIDERDQRVLELERNLDELKSKNVATEQEALRLSTIASEEKELKLELASQLRSMERSQTISPTSSTFQTLALPLMPDPVLVARIDVLQSSYEATLAQLESANVKYKDSLKEIEELNSQLEESKLISSSQEIDIVTSPSTPPHNSSEQPDLHPSSGTSPLRTRRSIPLSPQHQLSFLGRGQGVPQYSRSASLSQELSSAQGSQSSSVGVSVNNLSPRLLSSPNQREVGSSGSRSESTSPGGTRSYEHIKNEVIRLQEALNEREEEIMSLENRLQLLHSTTTSTSPTSPNHRASLSLLPGFKSPPRNFSDRDITPSPRNSVDDFDLSPATLADLGALKTEMSVKRSSTLSASGLEGKNSVRLDGIMRSMARKESGHKEAIDVLQESLTTLKRQHEALTILSRDQVLNMSTEIDSLRTQLEDQPNAASFEWRLKVMEDELEAKDSELTISRAQADKDLTATSTKLTEDHTLALQSTIAKHDTLLLQVQEEHASALRNTLAEKDETLRQKEVQYASALEAQSKEHAEVLQTQLMVQQESGTKSVEIESLLQKKIQEQEELTRKYNIERLDTIALHSTSLEKLESEHVDALATRHLDHEEAVAQLETQHAKTLSARDLVHSTAFAKLQEQHDTHLSEVTRVHTEEMEGLRISNEAALLALKGEHSTALELANKDFVERSRIVDESHVEAVNKLRSEHELALTDQASIHSSDLATKLAALQAVHTSDLLNATSSSDSTLAIQTRALEDRHAAEMAKTQSEHDALVQSQLSFHTTEHADTVLSLRDEHAKKIKLLSEDHASELAVTVALLKDEHSSSISSLETTHAAEITSLKHQHSSSTASVAEHHASELEVTVALLKDDHSANVSSLSETHAAELVALKKEYSTNMTSASDTHATELATTMASLKEEHSTITTDLAAAHALALSALSTTHQATLDFKVKELNASHEKEIATLRHEHETSRQAQSFSRTAELAAKSTSLESEHVEALASLNRSHSDDYEKRSRELQSSHLTSIADLHSVNQASLSALASTHAKELDAQVTKSSSHSAALLTLASSRDQEQQTKLKDAHISELANLNLQHASTLEQQSTSQSTEFETEISSLKEANLTALSQLASSHEQSLSDLSSTHTNTLEGKITELNDSHSSDLARLQLEHEKALQSQTTKSTSEFNETSSLMAAKHFAALSSLSASHQITLDSQSQELKDVHSVELKRLASDHQAALDASSQSLKEKLESDQQSALESTSQSLKDSHSLKLDTLRKEHAVALADQASTHSSSLAATIATLSTKHSDDLQDTFSVADSELRAQMQHVAESHYSELANIRASHASALALQSSTSTSQRDDMIALLTTQHEVDVNDMSSRHEYKIKEIEGIHSSAIAGVSETREGEVKQLKESYESALREVSEDHSKALLSSTTAAGIASVAALALQAESHATAITLLESNHTSSIASLRSDHADALLESNPAHEAELRSLNYAHSEELKQARLEVENSKILLSKQSDLEQQVADLQQNREATATYHANELDNLEQSFANRPVVGTISPELQQALDTLSALEKALRESQDEREKLKSELQVLRTATSQTNRLSTTGDGSLRGKKESMYNGSYVNGNQGLSTPDSIIERSEYFNGAPRTDPRLSNPIAIIPPPPTPPPTMPPPPLPTSLPRSPTSRSPSWHSPPGLMRNDSRRSVTNPDALIFKMNEQEASITRLNKQLAHCETDLQSNIDLVNTLESALNDSERSLRKARTQMNDMAKDRDTYKSQNEELRLNITNAKSEVESVRHATTQVESRLQDERRGKERAKAELEKRLEEVNRQKRNKFACF